MIDVLDCATLDMLSASYSFWELRLESVDKEVFIRDFQGVEIAPSEHPTP
jgi:hypothetical protein